MLWSLDWNETPAFHVWIWIMIVEKIFQVSEANFFLKWRHLLLFVICSFSFQLFLAVVPINGPLTSDFARAIKPVCPQTGWDRGGVDFPPGKIQVISKFCRILFTSFFGLMFVHKLWTRFLPTPCDNFRFMAWILNRVKFQFCKNRRSIY